MIRTELEVWTARMSRTIEDPDSLDISRDTADIYAKKVAPEHRTIGWQENGIVVARARQRSGLTLHQIHRLAFEDSLPSLGAVWAPTWDILKPALAGMDLADLLGKRGLANNDPAMVASAIAQAKSTWIIYRDGYEREGVVVEGFNGEMRRSWRPHVASWRWIFGQKRLVLRCFCPKPKWWPADEPWTHCHRFLAARILETSGATYRGEIEEPPSPQMGLPLG